MVSNARWRCTLHHKPQESRIVPRKNKLLREVVRLVRKEVARHYGSDLTFEERRDAAVAVTHQALWLDEELDLTELVTQAAEVRIEGKRYRRLQQASSADYSGRWGPHHIEESLYRQQGVRNGPTVKPVELRAGIVENMTPDLARIVGQLSSEHTSRQLVSTLLAVGLVPPSRSPLEKHVKRMATDMSGQVEALEEAARKTDVPPPGVAAVSCGMDRGAVRMVEPLAPGTAPATERRTPYERTPPPPSERRYRMAWNGNTTLYDSDGKPLHTFRYAAQADAAPEAMARRIAADVAWISEHYPTIDLHCIQDGAPELRVLPKTLDAVLPANTRVQITDLVDFKHLMGYLDAVVDTCEQPGDPRNKKQWYHDELLRDDGAIDRIWRKLRDLAKSLPRDRRRQQKKRKAIAAALSYIRTRKNRMRYASLYKNGLPIGSGDTENTVWLMQQRVKRPAQAWKSGLGGVLVLRALVLSERWDSAWKAYAASYRKTVRVAA